MPTGIYERKDILERLWEKTTINKKTDCWLWRGHLDKDGYGRVEFNGKLKYIHRISYRLFVGKIIKPLVCHRCDIPNCWNPDHLFNGTYQDNSNDMIKKGRQTDHIGENNNNSKLTDKQVRQIRKYWNTGEYYQKRFS